MSGFSHNKESRRANSLAPGMSRHDNIWDNVVAESFFDLLKKEPIRKGSTKLASWSAPISSITLKCSEIRPGITAIPVVSVRSPSDGPQREDGICLLLRRHPGDAVESHKVESFKESNVHYKKNHYHIYQFLS